MNWYSGSISDAIRTAKSQKAIFVVFVEGTDENSQLMLEVLNTGEICSDLNSNGFVAIKLSSDDVGYRQFVEIYKLVPVPSLFFIGDNGAPLDIVAADASRSSLEMKIKEALIKCNVKVGTVAPSPVTTDAKGPSTSQVAEQLVAPTPVDNSGSSSSLNAEDVPKPSLEEKVEIAKQLLEKKKQDKEIKDKEEEKRKEFERRRVGQEMQKAKQKQQDRELKEMIEEREREKRESAAAKQRILEQIAQDRAERAEREQRNKAGNESKTTSQLSQSVPVESRPINVNATRIQFKLPTGEARTHSFPPDTTILQVREFINNNIELSFRDYKLATAFPKREFTREDDVNTLSSLNLIPTGVILILPVSSSNVRPYSRDWLKIVSDLFWDMVQPVFSIANYIQQYFTSRPSGGSPSDTPASPPQQPSSKGSSSFVKKAGNIHSLKDIRDGNDENNTWNGNSTQQM